MILSINNKEFELCKINSEENNTVKYIGWIFEIFVSIIANDLEETWGAEIATKDYRAIVNGYETPQNAFDAAIIAIDIEKHIKTKTYIEFLKYKKFQTPTEKA